MVELDRMRMRAYYERMEREGGFVSFCRMWLPEDIAGARVLDVGCRRGKGTALCSVWTGANHFSSVRVRARQQRLHVAGFPRRTWRFALDGLRTCALRRLRTVRSILLLQTAS